MKTYLSPHSIVAGLLLLVSVIHVKASNNPDFEKTKTFSKSHNIGGNDRISVSNQFGEVKINNWDKNEVKVDVTIIGKSSTEQRAQEIIDRISIEDGKDGNGFYFKTNMKNEKKNTDERKNYKDEKMEINYQVYMPNANALILSNQFGASIVPDMNGSVDLTNKFGSLTTGKLRNVKNIHVEFGSASIESINSGTLVIKFSRAIINNLDGDVKATFEHCGGVKLGVSNATKNLSVNNNFTKLYLDLNKNLSANFDISTHFGHVSNKSSFDIKEEGNGGSRGPNFNHRYSGKAGNGNAAMKIKSQFGEVLLGHNLVMDLKEEKTKKKVTDI